MPTGTIQEDVMTIADRAVPVTAANRGNGAENGRRTSSPIPGHRPRPEGWRSGAAKAFERRLPAPAEAEPVAS
jgi:hypothetical protein